MSPRKKSVGQVTIARLGEHGSRVRVFHHRGTIRVQSRSLGLTKSYRGPDAEAKAMGFANGLLKLQPATKATVTRTVGELWTAYQSSSDYRELRQRSKELYAEAWALFVALVPHATACDAVSGQTLQMMRTVLEDTPRERTKRPLALNTIRKAISIVKGVFAWGERTETLQRNRLHLFKFKVGKDNRPAKPDEYTSEEFAKLIAGLSFERLDQRTPYCVLSVCGYQGVRINAVTRLRWEDVLWESNVLMWRARWDKMGNEWDQPLRVPTRMVLQKLWESVGCPKTGWVFASRRNKGETYTPSAFISVLHNLERRVGVEVKARRASHGFRRMVAGDLAKATGSGIEAMHGIGDNDIRQANTYIKTRSGDKAKAMRKLDEGNT